MIAAGFASIWAFQAYQSRWHGERILDAIITRHIGRFQPLGLPISAVLVLLDADGEKEAAQQRAAYHFGASAQDKIDTVVFVIGESARADHWQLNGYSRPTTPRLAQLQNLVNFSNVVSLAPNTGMSWPFIFTPRIPEDQSNWPNKKSFISAFREAGYHTYFVSFYLDQKSSARDTMAVIGLEAETVTNGSPDSAKKTTDVAMLPAIIKVLSEKPPKLVVISTLGSHTGFETRVPLRYDVFQPSVLTGTRTPEGWRNGYDDSILMTDDFLATVIAGLKGRRSLLFYVSDHGLACYDKGELRLGQAYLKAEYRPACFVWASTEFLEDSGCRARFNLGLERSGTTMTSDYILDSFMDLCGIQTDKLVPAESVFNPKFKAPSELRVKDYQGEWHNFSSVPDF
jgi:glucan phosphoethanolaminetransferase (alkaline phosphatase superfamily)